jgi:flagellar hook-associated protein 3 FlgL
MLGISTTATAQKSFELRSRIAEQSGNLNQASIELSTGFKQDAYKDVRGVSGETLSFRAGIDATEAYVLSNDLLSSKMDSISDNLSNMREQAGDFSNLLISGDIAGMHRGVLQSAAKSTIEQIVSKLNSSYAGSYVFSGLASDTQAVVQNADWTVTYTGDTTGSLSARIDEETTLEYGVRADDPGFTAIMGALAVVASTDLDALSDADFSTLRDSAISAISSGVERLIEIHTRLGDNQGVVERTVERQGALKSIYSEAMLNIEGVDAEEAAVRLTSIQGQLQATYAVTARMSEMSLLNYL